MDLLGPAKGELKLREDPQRGFFVEGARQEALGSLQQALALVEAGSAQRKVRERRAWEERLPDLHSLLPTTSMRRQGKQPH